MALYHSSNYQTSFQSVGFSIQKKFNIDFQDGGHGGIFDFPSERFKLFLIYKSPRYFLRSFKSIGLSVK